MVQFEVATTEGLLGVQPVTADNVEKHGAAFGALLDRGVVLASVTVAVTSGTSVANTAALSVDHKSVSWFIYAAADAENCVMELTVTTNDGQTLHYTVQYAVG